MEYAITRVRTTQNLPDGVVVHALSFLDHVDLCAAATTARRWRQAVDTRALWTALLQKRCPTLLRAMGNCGEPRQLFTRMARKLKQRLPETPLSDVVLLFESDYKGEITLSVACPLDELILLETGTYLIPNKLTGAPTRFEETCRSPHNNLVTITLIRKSDNAIIRNHGAMFSNRDTWHAYDLSPRIPGHSFARYFLAESQQASMETYEFSIEVQAKNLLDGKNRDAQFERGDLVVKFCASVCTNFYRFPRWDPENDYVQCGNSGHESNLVITPRLLASLDWET
jgi:hypothetical protein